VFENSVLGPKREKEKEDWGRVRDEEASYTGNFPEYY
jgi:hypothetical protein